MHSGVTMESPVGEGQLKSIDCRVNGSRVDTDTARHIYLAQHQHLGARTLQIIISSGTFLYLFVYFNNKFCLKHPVKVEKFDLL